MQETQRKYQVNGAGQTHKTGLIKMKGIHDNRDPHMMQRSGPEP